MLAYSMVRTIDDAGQEWWRLYIAHLYLAKLRKLERMGAVSDPNISPHIAECETHTRNEWRDKNLADPSLSLSDIIALSLEHDRFPDATKFTPSKMPRNRHPKQKSDFSQGPTPREAYPTFASEGPYKRNREADKEHSTRVRRGTPTWKNISATEINGTRALMASRVNTHTMPLRWRRSKHAQKLICGYKMQT